jgi:hypothetical protein
MKKVLLLLLCLCVLPAAAQPKHPLIKNCTITKSFGMMRQTWNLWGNVKVVTDPEEYADFDVKAVSKPDLADLYVVRKNTKREAIDCGEWHFVTDGEDANFTIRFVTEWEEFSIRFVDSMPGTVY